MTAYGKLVRDRIPEIIRADGRRPVVEVLADADRRRALRDKLVEEAAEAADVDDAGLVEELADVLEVVRSLAAGLGLSLADVVEVADRKAVERGSFAHGLLLVDVTDSEG